LYVIEDYDTPILFQNTLDQPEYLPEYLPSTPTIFNFPPSSTFVDPSLFDPFLPNRSDHALARASLTPSPIPRHLRLLCFPPIQVLSL
jgi:hypothetical protein